MDILRKFLATAAALLFILTAVLALFLGNLATIVTQRETMKTMVVGVDQWLLTNTPMLVADALQQQAARAGLPPLELDEAALSSAAANLLTPEWVSTQTNAVVDAIYNFLETGDVNTAVVTLDLTPVVQQMQGPVGEQLVNAILNSLPICDEPLANLALQLATGQIEFPRCIPAEVNTDILAAEIHDSVVQALQQNPQFVQQTSIVSVNLLTGPDGSITPERRAQLMRWRDLYQMAETGAWLLWLLPVAALFLLTLLAVRSLRTWGLWWGWPFVLAGLGALLLALVLPSFLWPLVRTAVSSSNLMLSGLPMQTLLRGTVEAASDIWLNRVTVQAGGLLLAGLVLVILGFTARQLPQR